MSAGERRLAGSCSTSISGPPPWYHISASIPLVSKDETCMSHDLYLPARSYCPKNCLYGAPYVAAGYVGLPDLRDPRLRGEWAHGWHPPTHNIHPELVIGSTGKSRLRRHFRHFWVARQDQVDYLSAHGYLHVRAIGLPVVYLPPRKVSRERDSLLVMPVHSLDTTQHNWNFERYAEEIAKLRGRFSRIVICVHTSCAKKGYWVRAFEERGFPIVFGADVGDRNSLLRMKALFSQFEFVTSNGFGSHLAYAAYFGAKPSVYGELPLYQEDDFKNDRLYRSCPDLVQVVLGLMRRESIKSVGAWLFSEPDAAKEALAWGAFQVGHDHKVSPRELQMIFAADVRARLWFGRRFGLSGDDR